MTGSRSEPGGGRHGLRTALPPVIHRPVPWLLGSDRPFDLALVVATFALFVVLDRLTRLLVVVELDDLGRRSLVLAAMEHRWWLALAMVVVAGTVAWRWSDRLLARWSATADGRALRLLIAGLVVLVAWQAALYRYNWLAGRSHWPDRLLVLALAVAALARPVFLIPFVAVARIVVEQFVLPFGTTAARNVEDLLLMSLLAVAAGHLIGAFTGSDQTSSTLLIIAAAVAAHFFVPGRGKLAIGWVGVGRVADLPLAAHSVGWRGQGDGGWARDLASAYDNVQWPVKVSTLGLELGSVVAVASPRLLRWWLPACVAFHTVVFATTGFWFGAWVALELALLAMLGFRALRPVARRNATPARGLVAVLAVLAAPLVFHPPGLAWLDGPVSYGYRLQAVDASGVRWAVPFEAFEPLDHHLAFKRLELGPRPHAVGAYGAVASRDEMDALATIDTFDELTAYESSRALSGSVEVSTDFLEAFLVHAARPEASFFERVSRRLAPPAHFWTGVDGPAWDHDEPLRRVEVEVVRSIHHRGHPEQQRVLVLVLEVDADGRVVVERPAG